MEDPPDAASNTPRSRSVSSNHLSATLGQAGWNMAFRGHWTPLKSPLEPRGRSVIEINGSIAKWRSGSAGTLEIVSPSKVNLEKGGRTFSGKLDKAGKLSWDNGHVWIRHEMTEGRQRPCKLCLGTGERNPCQQVSLVRVGKGQGTMRCPHCFG